MPLVLFVAIVWLSYLGLGLEDRDKLPSALIGKPFPNFEARSLFDASANIGSEQLIGRPTLVNVWATWCPTCKAEHAELIEIAEDTDLQLIGINYKDDRSDAIQWLAEFGNPFDRVLEDPRGDLGVELGVYGAPETFLLDRRGYIVYKRVGAITEQVWLNQMSPVVKRL
jgi:cytochrome c biogenesis protein CcmG/thiol:disulfide interchange protein DsbE